MLSWITQYITKFLHLLHIKRKKEDKQDFNTDINVISCKVRYIQTKNNTTQTE